MSKDKARPGAEQEDLLRRLEELIEEGERLKGALKDLEGLVIKAITEFVKKELEESAREEGRPVSEEEMERVVKERTAILSRRPLALLEDLGRIVGKLVEELKSYRDDEEKRAMLGEGLDLPENKVFSTCLSVLARTEALWLGLSPVAMPAEVVMVIKSAIRGAIGEIGPWAARCIRWAREALPPTRPLHDVLMETEATLAETLPLVLMREEMDMLEALRGLAP